MTAEKIRPPKNVPIMPPAKAPVEILVVVTSVCELEELPPPEELPTRISYE